MGGHDEHESSAPTTNIPMFQQESALTKAYEVGMQGAGVGLLVSAYQNAVATHNKGALGILSRTGGTIGLFGGMGVLYAFTRQTTANYNQVDDWLSGSVGGFVAGFAGGLRLKSIPKATASGAALAGAIALLEATGGNLTGRDKTSTEEKRNAFFNTGSA